VKRRIPLSVLAAGVILAGVGLFSFRQFLRPRAATVCVVTDYSFRTAHPNWREVVNSRFAAVRRAFSGTGVAWEFRDADQPDPTGRFEGGIEERRRKLIRTECEADVILGITGLEGSRSDVPPFAHTAIVADLAARGEAVNRRAWIQGLAALFGVPPGHISGDRIPDSDRKMIRQLREYDFAQGTKGLEGEWGDRAFRALAAASSAAEAQRVIGMSLAADGFFAPAIERLKARVALEPSNVAAHVDLATIYAHNYEAPKAIEEYRAAVKLDPNGAPARAALAVALANAGLAEDAVDEFRAALRLDPKFLPAHAGLAYVLTQQPGRIDDAIAAYGAALEIDPKYAAAVEGLERARALKADAQQALAEQQRKAQGSASAVAHFNLGLTEARAGNAAAAVRELQRSVELDPGYGLAHMQLALLLYHQGDGAAALRHAESAERAGYEPPKDILERLKAGR
jgi:tetratricopeptide (TPR) repeat protein